MTPKQKLSSNAFDRDVESNQGYLYTENAPLSSCLANRRLTDATLSLIDLHGQQVVDIGCGDGTYTFELYHRAQPSRMAGIDFTQKAIDLANSKVAGRPITFAVGSACDLPYQANSFDIAHLRGLLHHVDRPADVLGEAFRIAPAIVIIEPNGYNLGLKLLEKFSAYHIEHKEKSYAPGLLDRWIGTLGGRVTHRTWVGSVPFFAPDRLTRALKFIEPLVEKIPVLNMLGCAAYVLVAERADR